MKTVSTSENPIANTIFLQRLCHLREGEPASQRDWVTFIHQFYSIYTNMAELALKGESYTISQYGAFKELADDLLEVLQTLAPNLDIDKLALLSKTKEIIEQLQTSDDNIATASCIHSMFGDIWSNFQLASHIKPTFRNPNLNLDKIAISATAKSVDVDTETAQSGQDDTLLNDKVMWVKEAFFELLEELESTRYRPKSSMFSMFCRNFSEATLMINGHGQAEEDECEDGSLADLPQKPWLNPFFWEVLEEFFSHLRPASGPKP